jgi:hypothetical protein
MNTILLLLNFLFCLYDVDFSACELDLAVADREKGEVPAHCRTMILPALAISPAYSLTLLYFGLLSLPFLVDPCPFLCAIKLTSLFLLLQSFCFSQNQHSNNGRTDCPIVFCKKPWVLLFGFDDCLHLRKRDHTFGSQLDFTLRVDKEAAGDAVYKIVRPGHSRLVG